MSDRHEERITHLEDDLYRQDVDRPGTILRLDRVERLLHVMLKIIGVLGGLAVTWKIFDVLASVLVQKAAQ